MISSNNINKFLEYLNTNNSLDRYLYTDCIFHTFIRDVDMFLHNSIDESIMVKKAILLGVSFKRYYHQYTKNVR